MNNEPETNHQINRDLVGPVSVLMVLALVAALVLARAVFIPLAIAILLSFLLNPLVQVLKRLRLGRIPSVLVAVLIAFSLIGGLAAIITRQIRELANDLPRYEATLRDKMRDLQDLPFTSGVLKKASDTLGKLGDEIEPSQKSSLRTLPPSLNSSTGNDVPVPVEIRQPPIKAFESFQRFLINALTPLATSGIVLLLVIGILLQREDLRDRIIRLAGARDLERTTEAMDDAASRLSQFYLAQTLANAVYGSSLAIGLLLIGVPNPVLWGIMASVLRFVPSLGGLLAAALPIAIAAAVDPGWFLVAATTALYVAAELIMGQLVEPRFRGRLTGLSPLAGLLATMFWTWAWGPIGLVLATPLTVLLIVLGKHVERLDFLEVLLGAKPALTPIQMIYQRLLAGDPEDAAVQAEEQLKERSFIEYADQIVLPGLQLAQSDFKRGALDMVRTLVILRTLEGLISYLPDLPSTSPSTGAATTLEAAEDKLLLPPLSTELFDKKNTFEIGEGALVIGGRTSLDQAAGLLLSRVLLEQGTKSVVITAQQFSQATLQAIEVPIGIVAISYLDIRSSQAHARFFLRRIRQVLPGRPIILCFWRDDSHSPIPLPSGKDLVSEGIVVTMQKAAVAVSALQATRANGIMEAV